jgi:methyl-accepting chemotaxis protein
MENANLLIAFIALTAAAVVIQAGILIAMYLATRQTGARVESLATEVRTKVLPTVEIVQEMLTEMRPKLESLMTNVSDSSALVRAEVERLDATFNDVVDRTRLQVIRADELLSRTLDRVEQATDMVHKTVISPIRQASGLVQGLSAGLEFFFSRARRQRNGTPVAQDEMFI